MRGIGKLVVALTVGLGLGSVVAVTQAQAAGEARAPLTRDWSHAGPFGTFDRASIQRGMMVYREVCAACHGLEYVAFRNLVEIGLSEDEAKVIAAEYEITDGPDEVGDMFERPGKLSDYYPSPFPNANAARAANGGALPPDLSLVVKARKGGENYLYSLLVGYEDPPADVELGDTQHYNPYFAGGAISMAPPLAEDIVEYPDGTSATVEQMAYDVTNFLTWTAEPRLEDRKQLGVKVIIFLVLFSILMYAVKRKVWADLH